MKTAIITGASSGLGRELARQAAAIFPEAECFWLIARRAQRLEELAEALPGKTVACLGLDLCDAMSFMAYQDKLRAEQPEVVLLVNAAGCGYLGRVGETDTASQTRMVDLNVRAVTAVTHMTVPYLVPGARVLNVSSIAAFCPCPRMTVYSATKAYVSAFSRGLGEELSPAHPGCAVPLQGLCLRFFQGAGRGTAQPGCAGDGGVPRPHADGVSGSGRHRRQFPDL